MSTPTTPTHVTGLLSTSISPPTRWDTVAIVHTAAATGVLGLGAAILFMRKGTVTHTYMGRVWTSAMLITCFSSYGLSDSKDGKLNVLHGLSTLTICAIGAGVYSIRKQKNVRAHVRYMKGSYIFAVLVGLLAVATPGRRLHDEFFGKRSHHIQG